MNSRWIRMLEDRQFKVEVQTVSEIWAVMDDCYTVGCISLSIKDAGIVNGVQYFSVILKVTNQEILSLYKVNAETAECIIEGLG